MKSKITKNVVFGLVAAVVGLASSMPAAEAHRWHHGYYGGGWGHHRAYGWGGPGYYGGYGWHHHDHWHNHGLGHAFRMW